MKEPYRIGESILDLPFLRLLLSCFCPGLCGLAGASPTLLCRHCPKPGLTTFSAQLSQVLGER